MSMLPWKKVANDTCREGRRLWVTDGQGACWTQHPSAAGGQLPPSPPEHARRQQRPRPRLTISPSDSTLRTRPLTRAPGSRLDRLSPGASLVNAPATASGATDTDTCTARALVSALVNARVHESTASAAAGQTMDAAAAAVAAGQTRPGIPTWSGAGAAFTTTSSRAPGSSAAPRPMTACQSFRLRKAV